jgi:hypothetical protein
MTVRIVSYEAALRQAIGVKLASNLGDAAALLRAEIQAAVGIQGPPRSSPGQPPHRDSGELQASFFDELDADALVARVGSDSDHVLAMELGSGRVAARPHIVSTLIEQSDALARIICRQ